MKKKRPNPRRIPVSHADIKRAKHEAIDLAMKRMLYMMLFILIDKHNAPKEDIQQLAGEVNYLADSIRQGYVTWNDIERVVIQEYETKIDLY